FFGWIEQKNPSFFFCTLTPTVTVESEARFAGSMEAGQMGRAAALKQRLAAGKPIYGLIHGLASVAVAELAALAGYDVVIVDDEHGAGDSQLHLGLFHAIAAGGASSMVRLPCADAVRVGRALDLGVDGLLVPGIHC